MTGPRPLAVPVRIGLETPDTRAVAILEALASTVFTALESIASLEYHRL